MIKLRKRQLVLILTVFFATGMLSGCGAIKAYPGPELPDDQLSLLRVQQPIFAAYAGSINLTPKAFNLFGSNLNSDVVKVLPGEYPLRVTRQWREPSDCYERQEFDSSSYDSCLRLRDENLRKGKYASSCYVADFTKLIQNCEVKKTYYSCEKTVPLKANTRYTIEDIGGKEGLMRLVPSDGSPVKLPCKYHSDETVREDTSSRPLR
jgi:hypothetical protein